MTVGYSGPPSPRMLLIGEAWGADEDSLKLPLVGVSGQENWKMLGEALPDIRPDLHAYAAELCTPRWGLAWVRRRYDWLDAASIGFTNVLNCRPPDNKLEELCDNKAAVGGKDYPFPALTKGKYLKPQFFHHLERLARELADLRPNLVVCLGNTPCWALLGTTGITAIRGTTTAISPSAPINHFTSQPLSLKCLPTFHPASLLYEGQWSRRPIIVADYMKAAREAQFPEIRRPSRSIIINPSLEEVSQWIRNVIGSNSHEYPLLVRTSACDSETSIGIIDTIGFAASPENALVIPFGPHRYKRGDSYIVVWPERDGKKVTHYWTLEEERQVWQLVKLLLESPTPKVFQNGLYDIQYIWRMGITPNNCKDDTMLAWHVLYPELPKSLGFLGSALTDETAWKNLSRYKSDTEKRDE